MLIGDVCATDRANPDGGCGCGRAFTGMSSRRATTSALVRDLDLSADDVRLAIESHAAAAGLGPLTIGEGAFAELVAGTFDELRELSVLLPEGAVMGRRLDTLVRREEPAAARDH